MEVLGPKYKERQLHSQRVAVIAPHRSQAVRKHTNSNSQIASVSKIRGRSVNETQGRPALSPASSQSDSQTRRFHRPWYPAQSVRHRARVSRRRAHRCVIVRAHPDRTKDHAFPRSRAASAESYASRSAILDRLPHSYDSHKTDRFEFAPVRVNSKKCVFIGPQIGCVEFNIWIVSHVPCFRCRKR